jgi:hypothetical protein
MDCVGGNGEDADEYGGSQQGGAETAHDVSLPWRRSGVIRRDALIVWVAQAGPPELVGHTGDIVAASDLLVQGSETGTELVLYLPAQCPVPCDLASV